MTTDSNVPEQIAAISNDLEVPSWEWAGPNKGRFYSNARGQYLLALAVKQGSVPKNIAKKLQKANKPNLVAIALNYHRAPLCEAKIPNLCTTVAQDIHHKARRGRWLTAYTPLFMAVCRACHTWVENNKEEAEEKGWYFAYQEGASKVAKRRFDRSSREGNTDGKFHTQQTSPEEYNNQPLLPSNLSKRSR